MSLPRLDRHGWLLAEQGITRLPSPNVDARPAEAQVSLLVVHNITLPPGQLGGPYVADLFLNRLDLDTHPVFMSLKELRVSAHFFIRRTGSLIQFASIYDRAWHAGLSRFADRERCNDFSVGVELEGTDDLPYTDAQYTTLAQLSARLRARCPIRAVRGHEHIAPGRKTDPGPAFDWRRFGREAGFLPRDLPPSS